MDIFSLYNNCVLCPKECGVNRTMGQTGFCGSSCVALAAKAYLHKWEEPCLSGTHGSGTVFFSGCSLQCVYCQNRQISRGKVGKPVSVSRLSEIYFELQSAGAHNINLVTPTHFLPHIVTSVKLAKENGVSVPFVYNTSGYEKSNILKLLRGCIDIYLTDFKYYSNAYAKRYSNAANYRTAAASALNEMLIQTGSPEFGPDELLKKGTIVRHLLLPGMAPDSKRILKLLFDEHQNNVIYSIMNQYTPIAIDKKYNEINRKVSQKEYDEVVAFAENLGIENCYIQYGDCAKESFIPNFDCSGI